MNGHGGRIQRRLDGLAGEVVRVVGFAQVAQNDLAQVRVDELAQQRAGGPVG
jgi:hypothetical protein